MILIPEELSLMPLKIFNQLLLNGIRYIPKYDIILKELTAENTSCFKY